MSPNDQDKDIVERLKKMSIPVKGKKDLENVAIIAANNTQGDGDTRLIFIGERHRRRPDRRHLAGLTRSESTDDLRGRRSLWIHTRD
jgi:hypothetical protein